MKKALLLALALLALPAFAQSRLHITGNPVADVQADLKDAKATPGSPVNLLAQLRAKFTADLTADLTSALTLAQQVPAGCSAPPPTVTACAVADSTAIPCYQALISLNGVINSYTPPADKAHVISDLEQMRIVARTIQSTNFRDACAPLVQDVNSQANQLVAQIFGIIGGAAKIGIALP
jgi:hypothetical protein